MTTQRRPARPLGQQLLCGLAAQVNAPTEGAIGTLKSWTNQRISVTLYGIEESSRSQTRSHRTLTRVNSYEHV